MLRPQLPVGEPARVAVRHRAHHLHEERQRLGMRDATLLSDAVAKLAALAEGKLRGQRPMRDVLGISLREALDAPRANLLLGFSRRFQLFKKQW